MPPVFDQSLNNFVILDNVPKITQEKVPKLTQVLQKVLQITPNSVVNITLPADDKEPFETLGFCYVEYKTASHAIEAVEKLQNYRFDKKHVFSVYHLKDFNAIMNTPETYTPPDSKQFDDNENLQYWLLNSDCDDQFVVRRGSLTSVYWNKKDAPPTIAFEKDNFSDGRVLWSPKGTYLLSHHRQGVTLAAGKLFKRPRRLQHPDVIESEFSPCEKYVVTFSQHPFQLPNTTDAKDQVNVVIWEIKTGERKLTYNSRQWPLFKWSFDGQYFGILSKSEKDEDSMIHIFQSSTMTQLPNGALKIPGVQQFAWSPADNFFSYWTPEKEMRPARVCIVQAPAMKDISGKNMFNVKECSMYWQESGDYLCVKVERSSKNKKISYALELFSLRKKLVPCELLELKDKFEFFSWSPVEGKFALIHGEMAELAVSFYSLESGKAVALKTFERDRNVKPNQVVWSPKGQYCVVARVAEEKNAPSLAGCLDFIDTNESGEVVSMTTELQEHPFLTSITWDPTGRFVTTVASGIEMGYWIWNFQGKPLRYGRQNVSDFQSFSWRPRPPTLLSDEQIQKLKGSMKTYSTTFEAQDNIKQSQASDEQKRHRRSLDDAWRALMTAKRTLFQTRQERLAQLRPSVAKEDQVLFEVEQLVEYFEKEDTEIVTKF